LYDAFGAPLGLPLHVQWQRCITPPGLEFLCQKFYYGSVAIATIIIIIKFCKNPKQFKIVSCFVLTSIGV
jgi:hypothetical protein